MLLYIVNNLCEILFSARRNYDVYGVSAYIRGKNKTVFIEDEFSRFIEFYTADASTQVMQFTKFLRRA